MAGKRTPSLIAGVRAAANDVTVALGMVQMRGGLYSPLVPNAKKEEGFKLACPSCDPPTKPDQKYVCPECGSQSTNSECKRALPDFSAFVDPNAISEAKASEMEKNFLTITVHSAKDVAEQTFPGEKTWIFRPKDKASTEVYSAFLTTLSALDGQVLMGQMNFGEKMGEKLVRLDVQNGELVLQELVRPEDRLDLPPAETVDVSAANLTMIEALIAATEEPFDAEDYRSQARERIVALKAEAAGGTAPVPGKPASAPKAQDLSVALEAALAAARAKRAS